MYGCYVNSGNTYSPMWMIAWEQAQQQRHSPMKAETLNLHADAESGRLDPLVDLLTAPCPPGVELRIPVSPLLGRAKRRGARPGWAGRRKARPGV